MKKREHSIPKNNWKINLKDILIPVLSTIVALAGIASGFFMQRSAIQSQIETKRYEITFTSNQRSYAEFMQYLQDMFDDATLKNTNRIVQSLKQLQFNYYLMEPFLKDENSRDLVTVKISEYYSFCYDVLYDIDQRDEDQILIEYLSYKYFFRETLCEQLFGIMPSSK
jgi:CRISPR/Cas system CSM-associated protein Csm2 small subunit